MYNVFNMGMGMAFVVSQANADAALASLAASGETPFVAGAVCEGNGEALL
jgi:phosphoribosylformylglycinamidine cyclo-ligase